VDIYPIAQRWKKNNPDRAMNSLTWLGHDVATSIKHRTAEMPNVSVRQGRDPPKEVMTAAEMADFLTALNGESPRQ
jgi:hypothetical protein